MAKFLNEKHGGHYRMYNLCSEKTYNSRLFGGDDVVRRYMIDDHNVPSLGEMVRFSGDVGDWLAADTENVIVVHCKGGKARRPNQDLEFGECLNLRQRSLFQNKF